MSKRYLEDFAVGQTFSSGRWRITKEQIKAFANEFDPQPFHLNETAAHDTFFQGLVASGWHTAALTMRLLVESERAGGRRHWCWVRRISMAETRAAGGRVAHSK